MKKDKQVLELLKQDMDKRNIPDFWDDIQKQTETAPPHSKLAFHQTSRSTNNIIKLLSLVAAAVFLFNVIPAIIISILTGTPFNFGTAPGFIGGTRPAEPDPDKDFNYSHVNRLEQKHFYGSLEPSQKTFDELIKIFPSLIDGGKVYEDDEYIYKFDKIGTLEEMLCSHKITTSAALPQKEIEKITDSILDTYFYMFTEIKNETTETISQNDELIWNIDFVSQYSYLWFDSYYATYTSHFYHGIHIELSPDGKIIKLTIIK